MQVAPVRGSQLDNEALGAVFWGSRVDALRPAMFCLRAKRSSAGLAADAAPTRRNDDGAHDDDTRGPPSSLLRGSEPNASQLRTLLLAAYHAHDRGRVAHALLAWTWRMASARTAFIAAA